ncbi:hypothetical protein [Haloarcula amylovorans]|uniref:hypothetical protein n=1 Tax=Haloarcula amylovorans TaxID=2562280 RepID=UPI001076A853|nr:hypothetical protein [Halomicroarcula amylolytica]
MTELKIGGSNMTVELRDNSLYAESNTGNKQWVAVITDTDPTYNYEREFVAYQKPKTSNRDSGSASVEDGAVIERVRYTHSGKNRKDQFFQLVDGGSYQIDEADVEAALDGEIIPDIEPGTHECEECGDEFDSEHGLSIHEGMVHSEDEDESAEPNAGAETDGVAEIVADGGETDIRSKRDLGQSDELVREYSADGNLYAYREDGEHVVVSRGNEPATRWTKRTPAERTAVVPGQQLWTIPDNWDERARIKGNAEERYAIYSIPETGVDVLLQVAHKNHLVDAWHSIQSIGQLSVTYADSCDWDELADVIAAVQGIDAVDEFVVDALDRLARRSGRFEREFADAVDELAEDALFRSSHGDTVRLDTWTSEPWGDTFDVEDLVGDILGIDGETLEGVMRELNEANIIPRYPTVRIDVDDGEGLPDEFYLRGLIQAGCSPPAAVDYLMTEIEGLSQTEWATERGKAQPSISNNVTKAERLLKA